MSKKIRCKVFSVIEAYNRRRQAELTYKSESREYSDDTESESKQLNHFQLHQWLARTPSASSPCFLLPLLVSCLPLLPFLSRPNASQWQGACVENQSPCHVKYSSHRSMIIKNLICRNRNWPLKRIHLKLSFESGL